MSNQQPLTMLVPIAADARPNALKVIGDAAERIKSGFKKSPSTHFARLVLLDNSSRLLFTSNFDGELAPYMKELTAAAGSELDTVWSLCEGYKPGDSNLLQELLSRYTIKVDTFYVALPGATVNAIRKSAAERENLDRELDQLPFSIVSTGSSNTQTTLVSSTATESPLDKFAEWVVGIREGVQEPDAVIRTKPGLYGIEDIFVQNQMTVIVPVKRNPLSRLILQIVLWATNRAAQNARGSLSGITTIHFARWTIIDGGDNLLFESNYDGSWESYIDDFVDSASVGMNLIWGNCVGFPTGGSRDVEAFKAYIRDNQIPSQVFYSAYEDLTMKNILTDLGMSGLTPVFARKDAEAEFRQGIYVGNLPEG